MRECECSYIKFSDGEVVHSINCSKNSFFNLENRHGFTSLGIEDVKKDYEKLEQELAKLTNKIEKAKKYIELCPCDPDIYPDQLEAWNEYQEAIKND